VEADDGDDDDDDDGDGTSVSAGGAGRCCNIQKESENFSKMTEQKQFPRKSIVRS
jgi:hypothetical protein